ncbi:hypothetical protein MA16_Dca015234 [Dendrobium catenatum]|uniref:Uncharacterized protein n=1 Tax=Dendrobium catenatum TaxID=906689 RepID=A0A2I0VSE1_9ASPA|nr:hypothetical protein MA16_Dca015234 [Dendrobium catenatum]
MKCAIFENRSTTTNMESAPRLVLGSPRTKSILKSSQMEFGIGNGVYSPVFCALPLYN